jgi:glycosyltransferase involved in cell wall biosynthesis
MIDRPSTPITVLTWDPVCRRSTTLASQLGQPLHTIHYLWYRKPWIAPIKYVAQTIKTFVVLRRERAQIVLVSNPPPFSVLAVYIYCRLFGARYVMDSHTGAFFEAKWTWLMWLHRFLARRAVLTLVTNEHLKSIVEAWGARALVLEDALPELRPAGSPDIALDAAAFNIVAIFSFYEDEPIEEMLAVRDLPPDVRIYVTGDSSGVKGDRVARLSPQVTLTGFLSEADYASLLHECDAVIVLCTRPHTMLCGAYEAAAAGKPLITSDWPEMGRYFSKGTLFVDNSTASIEEACKLVRERRGALTREMGDLRIELQEDWKQKFAACIAIARADDLPLDPSSCAA